jgi:hypothetical protein
MLMMNVFFSEHFMIGRDACDACDDAGQLCRTLLFQSDLASDVCAMRLLAALS